MSGEAQRGRFRASEAGYNFVALVIAVTVLNVMLAAALPLWSTAIRRDKEEELIARGLQYAEAVRVFINRFGRPPTRLKELVEVEPRSIRQLWTDPMSEDGGWGLFIQPPQRGAKPVKLPVPQPDAFGQKPKAPSNLPIAGVYSLNTEEALRSFFGKSQYDQWEFHYLIFTFAGPGAGGFGVAQATATPLPMPVIQLAKPFRAGLAPPGAGGAGAVGLGPGGQRPGSQPPGGPVGGGFGVGGQDVQNRPGDPKGQGGFGGPGFGTPSGGQGEEGEDGGSDGGPGRRR